MKATASGSVELTRQPLASGSLALPGHLHRSRGLLEHSRASARKHHFPPDGWDRRHRSPASALLVPRLGRANCHQSRFGVSILTSAPAARCPHRGLSRHRSGCREARAQPLRSSGIAASLFTSCIASLFFSRRSYWFERVDFQTALVVFAPLPASLVSFPPTLRLRIEFHPAPRFRPRNLNVAKGLRGGKDVGHGIPPHLPYRPIPGNKSGDTHYGAPNPYVGVEVLRCTPTDKRTTEGETGYNPTRIPAPAGTEENVGPSSGAPQGALELCFPPHPAGEEDQEQVGSQNPDPRQIGRRNPTSKTSYRRIRVGAGGTDEIWEVVA